MNYTTFHIVRKGEGKIVMKVATCIWHVEYIWWYEMYISYQHESYHNIVWLILKKGYFSDKWYQHLSFILLMIKFGIQKLLRPL